MKKTNVMILFAALGLTAAAALPPLPKPSVPDPKTLPQNAGRTLVFAHPMPRYHLLGAGETARPGEKNRRCTRGRSGRFRGPVLVLLKKE